VVTDRGRPVATLVPFREELVSRPLPDREKELSKLPEILIDSAEVVSTDRDRA
jgi:antitoxin (DNA-binding transcriptional repressor) of toxin-antitoxin stability system